ncbi:MAG: response regulator transcription factor [Oscillospiraceae bacterium]|nr:response regulator transcription factor [Oscillospiraceae bacterium]
MEKILIIEDDAAIADIERDFLMIGGYDVTVKTDGTSGIEEALTGQYSLVLLDLMLPGMDGYGVCKRIRDKINIPILMVTARTEEDDKVRGLGLGADDYISKPFSPTELVARVKANLAQYDRLMSASTGGQKRTQEIKSGALRLNPQTRKVFVGDAEIDLKNKEYELLFFLISHPNHVFSKERIYERIWGIDAWGDLKTVAVHINRLREKIEKDPQNPEYLQTVWGAGYRFRV